VVSAGSPIYLMKTSNIPLTVVRIVLAGVVALVFSACTIIGSPALTRSEKMAWSTYALATEKGLGTCVIVNCKDANAPGGVSPVLVTCAHVLQAAPRGPYFLVMRSPVRDANPDVAVLRIDIAPRCERPFIKHPQYDIAAMKIDIPPEVAHVIALPSFLSEATLRHQRAAHVGDEILVLGFPKVFPGTEGAFPVFRSGRIASYSVGSQADRAKYLIHSSIYSGDSGGPVFAEHGSGAPALLGLVSERIGPKAGRVPLAVAIDVSIIRETLTMLDETGEPRKVRSFNRDVSSAAATVPTVRSIGDPELLKKVLRAQAP
jgi:S1-C subfamily serine protease